VPYIFFTVYFLFISEEHPPIYVERMGIAVLVLIGTYLLFPAITTGGKLWRLSGGMFNRLESLKIAGFFMAGCFIGWLYLSPGGLPLMEFLSTWPVNAFYKAALISCTMGAIYLSCAKFLPMPIAALLGLMVFFELYVAC
jgi:hypothetical protein